MKALWSAYFAIRPELPKEWVEGFYQRYPHLVPVTYEQDIRVRGIAFSEAVKAGVIF